MNIETFLKDRKKAFTAAVMKNDLTELKKYCKKYDMPIPRDDLVMMVGCYKAVQECTDIGEDVKAEAIKKCLALGIYPFMR